MKLLAYGLPMLGALLGVLAIATANGDALGYKFGFAAIALAVVGEVIVLRTRRRD